jgi:hypothetical protein
LPNCEEKEDKVMQQEHDYPRFEWGDEGEDDEEMGRNNRKSWAMIPFVVK